MSQKFRVEGSVKIVQIDDGKFLTRIIYHRSNGKDIPIRETILANSDVPTTLEQIKAYYDNPEAFMERIREGIKQE